jgi:hypothetical protein
MPRVGALISQPTAHHKTAQRIANSSAGKTLWTLGLSRRSGNASGAALAFTPNRYSVTIPKSS